MSSVNVVSYQHNIVWKLGGHFARGLQAAEVRLDKKRNGGLVAWLGARVSWIYALTSFAGGTI